MSWLSNLFGHHSSNPANAAMPYLDQIYGQYGNPDLYNQISSQYKESPGYQARLHQALTAGNNASAAGGMLGTGQHQFNNMNIANDIASQDFNNYMNQRMGLNQDIGSLLGQKAQYAYGGQQFQNAQQSDMLKQLLGLLGMGGAYGLNKWG